MILPSSPFLGGLVLTLEGVTVPYFLSSPSSLPSKPMAPAGFATALNGVPKGLGHAQAPTGRCHLIACVHPLA